MALSMSRTQWWVGGIAVSLVVLILLAPLPVIGAAPQERHVTISARSFAFEPGTVRVNRGDTVIVNMESTDVVHGLYVDGSGVTTQAEPGRPGQLTFVADRDGAFRFRCNVTCGAMHPFMIGKITVGTNDWLYRSIGLASLAVIGFFPLSSFLNQSKKKDERNIAS